MKNISTGTERIKAVRGRPRQFDPDVVLAQARELFLRKGFSATSLDDLEQATGLARPSLYAAFGDKQALYIEVLRRSSLRSHVGLAALLDGPGSIRTRLIRVFEATADIYCANPDQRGCMFVNTAVTEAPSRPEIAHVAQDWMSGLEEAFAKAFRAAITKGEMSAKPSPVTRAQLACAILHSLAVRARLGADVNDLKIFARASVPAICGALPAKK